jgi:hypothetical protein
VRWASPIENPREENGRFLGDFIYHQTYNRLIINKKTQQRSREVFLKTAGVFADSSGRKQQRLAL